MEDIPSEDPLIQFKWVCEWLSTKGLNKTLDTLLDEYSEEIDNKMGLIPVPKKCSINPISLLKHTYEIHESSILCVRFHPTRPWFLSADGRKNLYITSVDGTVLSQERSNNPFMGCIISMECNPKHPQLLIIGTTDDRHALLEIKEDDNNIVSITPLQTWQLHNKYVARVKWSPDGTMFATSSHDGSINFFQLDSSLKSAQHLKRFAFSGCIEAIEYSKDGKYLIASERDNSSLHYIQVNTWDTFLANTNHIGDNFVSFAVLDLKSSPDGKNLLASTDRSRAIVFRQGTSVQVRNFYGFENDGYSQPRGTYDNYDLIYLTSQDNKVYIFDVQSGELVDTIKSHNGIIRDIDYHPVEDLLITCSYDKTIKLWERKKD